MNDAADSLWHELAHAQTIANVDDRIRALEGLLRRADASYVAATQDCKELQDLADSIRRLTELSVKAEIRGKN